MTTPWLDYDNTVKGQFDAATPDHSAWVSANAGSGKTKVLIDRVARLLLKGVKPDAILCVTYTKAAASEMQARLFKRLGGWCVARDDGLREELAELEQRDTADYGDDELAQARTLFAQALETPGGLRIETIHAFCGRLLRRFPLEAGAPPGFRELDDADASRLWRLALERLGLDAAGDDQALSEAVATVSLAAGGKGLADALRALTSKQAAINGFLHQQGGLDAASETLRTALGAPDETAETLINDAMGPALPRAALAAAVPVLLGGGKTDIKTGEIIEAVLHEKDPHRAFNLYSAVFLTGAGAFRSSNPYNAGIAKSHPEIVELFQIKEPPEGTETYRMRALIDKLKARAIYERSHALLIVAERVFSDFAREKRRRAALDFDDLIETASGLLTRRAAAQWVLWKLDGGLSHVLLDEAQDTSPDQWKLINGLTDTFFAGEGVERDMDRTLFVVGDEKQSIYSFQGADPERFLSERQKFQKRSTEARLEHAMPDILMSFRSAPEVLDFVDAVFDTDFFQGEAPFSMALPTENDVMRHLPFRREEHGSVELWPLEAPEAAEESTPWDAPRGQESETSPKAVIAARIARRASEMINRNEAVWDGKTTRPARPGDILILVRGRKGGLFDGIIKALKREGLPVAGADRIDLLDALPVQDLLNLVRFALCPEDDLTLAEILTGPFGGLNENDHLFDLAYDRPGSLWSQVQASTHPDIARVHARLKTLLDRRNWPPFEFLTAALDYPFADGRTGWDLVQSRFGVPCREPLTALMDRAAAFDASSPSSLQLFLTAIEREGGEVKRELSGPQDEVRVMTVHGAKGLEAPIVILPDTCAAPKTGVDNGLMVSTDDAGVITPAGMPIWAGSKKDDIPVIAPLRIDAEARALREHRRLLYVALTRAQDRLIICGAWTGGTRSKTGFAEGSWYAACQRAMQGIVDAGRAKTVENAQGEVQRFGDALFAVPSADDRHSIASAMIAPDWLFRPAPREAQATRYAAPSSLLGDEPPVLAPFRENNSARLARGRLIHTLLQTLPGLEENQREEAARRFLARDDEFTAAQHDEMLKVTLATLNNPVMHPVFAPGGRAEAPIVGGNDARLPKGMKINGRVDRLVITPDEVLIIDFKTDRPAPARAEDVGPAYTLQMAAYRAVLETAWPDRKIRCAIVWTDGPKLMPLPETAMDQALESLREHVARGVQSGN